MHCLVRGGTYTSEGCFFSHCIELRVELYSCLLRQRDVFCTVGEASHRIGPTWDEAVAQSLRCTFVLLVRFSQSGMTWLMMLEL